MFHDVSRAGGLEPVCLVRSRELWHFCGWVVYGGRINHLSFAVFILHFFKCTRAQLSKETDSTEIELNAKIRKMNKYNSNQLNA